MKEQVTGTGAQPVKRRTYTDDYRRQVVDMVVGTGRTAMSVAAEMGVHRTLISRWIRRYGQAGGAVAGTAWLTLAALLLRPVLVTHADQVAEIARLKRENERLQMEREILKRGIAIFAAPSP